MAEDGAATEAPDACGCGGQVRWESILDPYRERWLGVCECGTMRAFLPDAPEWIPEDPLKAFFHVQAGLGVRGPSAVSLPCPGPPVRLPGLPSPARVSNPAEAKPRPRLSLNDAIAPSWSDGLHVARNDPELYVHRKTDLFLVELRSQERHHAVELRLRQPSVPHGLEVDPRLDEKDSRRLIAEPDVRQRLRLLL